MIVELHIEHLVIDGGPLRRGDGDAVAAALTGEIRRLLADQVRHAHVSDDRLPATLTPTDWRSPERLGAAAARIVHAEVGSTTGSDMRPVSAPVIGGTR